MEEDKKEFKFKGPETHHGYTVYTVIVGTIEVAPRSFELKAVSSFLCTVKYIYLQNSMQLLAVIFYKR